jgi:hypothetical protein
MRILTRQVYGMYGIIVVGKPVDRLRPANLLLSTDPNVPSLVLTMQFVITHERWSSLLGTCGAAVRVPTTLFETQTSVTGKLVT